jgi:hypothetical protein
MSAVKESREDNSSSAIEKQAQQSDWLRGKTTYDQLQAF